MNKEEEQRKQFNDAIAPFKVEGVTEVTQEFIRLPVNYSGPSNLAPMEYPIETLKQSLTDHLPEHAGICMLGCIHITHHKVPVSIAFKFKGEASPYKIII